ncbi:MAG: SAM-dependent methyltransferase [Candidatus Improbicoccus devescovinae]|nr:MAG: SAM-dependent methyltransferase [Candidatus Improbicoccus devescovinae]
MKTFMLGPRLLACANFIKNSRIADIGSDHAKLPIWLAINFKIKLALACDISNLCIKRCSENIKKHNLGEIIKTRLSDGFENINEFEVDDIVISGLGGDIISRILGKCSWENKADKKFIIQPTSKIYELRRFLVNNGYKILKEIVVQERKRIYDIMLIGYTGNVYYYNELYPFIGEIFLCKNTKNLIKYLNNLIKDLENKYHGALIKKNNKKEQFYKEILYEIFKKKRMILNII